MKKIFVIFNLLCIGMGSAQKLEFKSISEFPPADTSSYEILQNPSFINVHTDLRYRKKIEAYRKKEENFILDFGNGLKVLIYKEEE